LANTKILRAESEEQSLKRLAPRLKGISDSRWNEIISSSATDNYEIVKGDNLWSVSKRIFGNAHYWPKVWSINNMNVGNPHILDPGLMIAFRPGGASGVPKIRLTTKNGDDHFTRGSHEYEKVPTDWWKPQDVTSLVQRKRYDDYGIDKELKIDIPNRFSLRIPVIANDAKLPHLGEVVASRRDGVGLSQGETIFIKSNNQDLQVGTSYSVFGEPEIVQEKKSDRPAYIYKTLGEVKIIGVKDELYIAMIEKGYDVIRRGDMIYPLLPLVTDIKPVASVKPIEALVFF
jgi:hypothetical protein